MSDPTRERRWWRWHAIASTVVLLGLLARTITEARSANDRVLDVERIDVRNPDGSLALVIAGKGRLPGLLHAGKQYPPELSDGRTESSGLIFFSESGDEVGGMTWIGRETTEGHEAAGHLAFDQWRQDEVVNLGYGDDGASRWAGLTVSDRPGDFPVSQLFPLKHRLETTSGAEREAAWNEVRALARAGKLGATRIALGSTDQAAELALMDRQGRPRIRLAVDASDVAQLEFLDEAGTVIARYPEARR